MTPLKGPDMEKKNMDVMTMNKFDGLSIDKLSKIVVYPSTSSTVMYFLSLLNYILNINL